MAEDLV